MPVTPSAQSWWWRYLQTLSNIPWGAELPSSRTTAIWFTPGHYYGGIMASMFPGLLADPGPQCFPLFVLKDNLFCYLHWSGIVWVHSCCCRTQRWIRLCDLLFQRPVCCRNREQVLALSSKPQIRGGGDALTKWAGTEKSKGVFPSSRFDSGHWSWKASEECIRFRVWFGATEGELKKKPFPLSCHSALFLFICFSTVMQGMTWQRAAN